MVDDSRKLQLTRYLSCVLSLGILCSSRHTNSQPFNRYCHRGICWRPENALHVFVTSQKSLGGHSSRSRRHRYRYHRSYKKSLFMTSGCECRYSVRAFCFRKNRRVTMTRQPFRVGWCRSCIRCMPWRFCLHLIHRSYPLLFWFRILLLVAMTDGGPLRYFKWFFLPF